MINLTGNRVVLRAVEPSDIDLIYLWENDPDNWFVSNTRTPYSRELIKKYVLSANQDIYEQKQLRLMIQTIEDNPQERSQPIGTIDLFDFDPYHQRAGVGILIAKKEYRSKGYATDALKTLIDYCFSILGLHQIYCNIASTNSESIRLFTKAGFVVTGTKKEWLRSGKEWIDELLLQNTDHSPYPEI
jgi:diamine N-acetyltransferase